jgi:hypothetical protein
MLTLKGVQQSLLHGMSGFDIDRFNALQWPLNRLVESRDWSAALSLENFPRGGTLVLQEGESIHIDLSAGVHHGHDGYVSISSLLSF